MRVRIRQARATVEVAEGQTLLEAAISAGVAYPHGCRSGRCGGCKSRLIEGRVELLPHTRFALSDDEKAEGLILACRTQPRTPATVAWLGDAAAVEPAYGVGGVVVGLDDLTHDIKRVRVSLEEGRPLFFDAGQYAQVRFKGAPGRSYSMANTPGQDTLEFHIRRVPEGRTSGYVHGALKIGDKARLDLPLGSSFLRQDHPGPILCIAGGSGLAPIQSIVETALVQGMRQPIHVYFGARAERDLYSLEHFQALARVHPDLAFTPVLSDSPTPAYRAGLVTQAMAQDLPDLMGWKAYVAGPPSMVEATMAAAFAAGLRRSDMHADVFFTANRSVVAE